MSFLKFGRGVIILAACTALFAGCASSQNALGPAAAPENTNVSRHATRSWVLPEAKAEDLLYAAGDGTSYILAYPSGKLVGQIASGAADACSDQYGNVFLTGLSTVFEYAHGSSSPSATLSVPNFSIGCAVDPSTGNLAVTYSRTSGDNVAIFARAQGSPTLYDSFAGQYCGYDNAGNLFIDDQGEYGLVLSELPAASNAFGNLNLTPSILRNPGRVQWDGSDITIEAGIGTHHPAHALAIYRLKVAGSTANVVGTTHIDGIRFNGYISWIYKSIVVVPYDASKNTDGTSLGIWKYPHGGKPQRRELSPAGNAALNAVTISVADSK